MKTLMRIFLAGGATLALAAAAQAADAPTEKAPPRAPAANCFASVWAWLDSTATDCPLSLHAECHSCRPWIGPTNVGKFIFLRFRAQRSQGTTLSALTWLDWVLRARPSGHATPKPRDPLAGP